MYGGGAHPSTLHVLRQSENFVAQRKVNIQRFGASWIRPPGVSKTYQAAMDEAAEREEQDRLMSQAEEDDLADMEGEGNTADPDGVDGGPADGDSVDGEDRDLDDDIPEAAGDDDDFFDVDDDDEDDDDDDGDGSDGMDELAERGNEDEGLFVPEDGGSAGDLAGERDLDEDVPEAGSYQHTDTELEDVSEEGYDASMLEAEPSRRGTADEGVGAMREVGGAAPATNRSGATSSSQRIHSSVSFSTAESSRRSARVRNRAMWSASSFGGSGPGAPEGDDNNEGDATTLSARLAAEADAEAGGSLSSSWLDNSMVTGSRAAATMVMMGGGMNPNDEYSGSGRPSLRRGTLSRAGTGEQAPQTEAAVRPGIGLRRSSMSLFGRGRQQGRNTRAQTRGELGRSTGANMDVEMDLDDDHADQQHSRIASEESSLGRPRRSRRTQPGSLDDGATTTTTSTTTTTAPENQSNALAQNTTSSRTRTTATATTAAAASTSTSIISAVSGSNASTVTRSQTRSRARGLADAVPGSGESVTNAGLSRGSSDSATMRAQSSSQMVTPATTIATNTANANANNANANTNNIDTNNVDTNAGGSGSGSGSGSGNGVGGGGGSSGVGVGVGVGADIGADATPDDRGAPRRQAIERRRARLAARLTATFTRGSGSGGSGDGHGGGGNGGGRGGGREMS